MAIDAYLQAVSLAFDVYLFRLVVVQITIPATTIPRVLSLLYASLQRVHLMIHTSLQRRQGSLTVHPVTRQASTKSPLTLHYTQTHDEQVKRKRGRRKRGGRNAQKPDLIPNMLGVGMVWGIQASVNPFSSLGMSYDTCTHGKGERSMVTSVKLLCNKGSKSIDRIVVYVCACDCGFGWLRVLSAT
jgi:hypothetical protein